MSSPDNVVPSLENCTARVAGLLGPSVNSNLALNDPEGAVSLTSPIFHSALLLSADLWD